MESASQITVAQTRMLFTEVRQLMNENKLQLDTILSNQMTVEQFCMFFALSQHKKRFQKN